MLPPIDSPTKHDRVERELVNDRRNIGNERRSREIVRVLLATAVPSLVQRESAKLISQAGCCLRPLTGVTREAVKEQDRRPLSANSRQARRVPSR